jgi:hypothetical protein
VGKARPNLKDCGDKEEEQEEDLKVKSFLLTSIDWFFTNS